MSESAAERQQFFALANYLANPFFRPYLPTCNLAVRRTDLERVSGFPDVRSGGDADLCWKVLETGDRHLVSVPDVLMEWAPRRSARGYLEQNYRYGRGNQDLRRKWAQHGAPRMRPSGWTLVKRFGSVGAYAALGCIRRDREMFVESLFRAGQLAFLLGQRLAPDGAAVPESTD